MWHQPTAPIQHNTTTNTNNIAVQIQNTTKNKYKQKQNECARIYCKYANVVTWQGEDNAEIASQETGLVWGANQKHANRFGTVCTHMGVIQIQSGTWHLDIVGQIQGVERLQKWWERQRRNGALVSSRQIALLGLLYLYLDKHKDADQCR